MKYSPELISNDLPVPEQSALEHSQILTNKIISRINDQGPLSFSSYMEMTLYEPGLGYYSSGTQKFGKTGDFVTAPEISSLFSECVAGQIQQVLQTMENPRIVELGPGSGRMTADVIAGLDKMQCLPGQYLLLEVSADLRERQARLLQKNIPQFIDNVSWLDHLPDNPVQGIIVANEVMDALPVIRVIKHESQWRELCVGREDDRLCWKICPLEKNLESIVESYLPSINIFPDGFITEINIRLEAWIKSLADVLDNGVLLLIDYGYSHNEYYHPQRETGTLICHYRHYVHDDPFLYPGLQDITASVDFTAVAEAGIAAGLMVSGYTTQAHFLINTGLGRLINEIQKESSTEQLELARQARHLTLPGEMGERVKVIAMTKNIDIPLMGFRQFDQRHRL